ncbi:DUF4097 family beta strand repeat-containing protein [Streptomyces sp. NPDC016845]|uniref:DUF4097 family beta strand repeat-containing protein n=1 Tax=Streptomyces sp. NPDC016845 TaxID=3364972 RepID=UPI0037B575CD
MQTFDTPAPVLTVLDLPAARVEFVAADRADTAVRVLPGDKTKSRDTQAAQDITVQYADGVLRIEAPEAKKRLLGPGGVVTVTVQLPAGSRVRARGADIDVRSAGRLADVDFEGARATVHLEEVEGARLSLMQGDVVVGRLDGSAEIRTRSGDITVTEGVRGTVDLRTESGAISVGAAPGVSAALDARTSYGRVHNSLKNADATPGLTVRATTSYGDITARSL